MKFPEKLIVFQNIANNHYKLIVVSPELLNDGRFKDLWGKKKFTDNIINLVLDEAHVIKEWGGTFRSDYLRIGPIHYLLPRMIPFHLGSATLGPKLERKVQSNLRLRHDSTSVFRMNTDRPNIFLVVERMKYPVNLYEDLAFIIQKDLKQIRNTGSMPHTK